jgi:hypothetical protein
MRSGFQFETTRHGPPIGERVTRPTGRAASGLAASAASGARQSHRSRIIQLLALLFVAASGCVTTTHVVGQFASPSARTQTNVSGGKAITAPTDDGPLSADDAVGTDPSEMRLQNIEAALLLYYSVNRSLPPRLEDLVALSSGDLPLTSPNSNQEYLYIKDGLPIPSTPRVVIVCEPTPSKSDKRWCIVMAPPDPNGALELEPQQLPESIFKNLQPAQ